MKYIIMNDKDTFIKLKYELITKHEWLHENAWDICIRKYPKMIKERLYDLWSRYVDSEEYSDTSANNHIKFNELLLKVLSEYESK